MDKKQDTVVVKLGKIIENVVSNNYKQDQCPWNSTKNGKTWRNRQQNKTW
ncbi:Maph109 [Matsumuraeses phaseoli granulovirus]|uniref:Maph109 n=1 Tax=Matsumuraeses phaseoli granulovirus TaxID=2760664 RepID=A0AAE7MLG9_9BBAC|nr:Maph109 [Matsumuraeses phaseoli granulovirus]QOD40072.1 Maph109 [Matsumuraeses phaseoli granulovirus]